MASCQTQVPFRDRMDAMYGCNGQVRDMLTDFSNPASGSYYFAPSVECLDAGLALKGSTTVIVVDAMNVIECRPA